MTTLWSARVTRVGGDALQGGAVEADARELLQRRLQQRGGAAEIPGPVLHDRSAYCTIGQERCAHSGRHQRKHSGLPCRAQ